MAFIIVHIDDITGVAAFYIYEQTERQQYTFLTE